MSTTTSAAELAAQFATVNDEIIAATRQCDAAGWQRITAAEGWTVAATVHHVAIVQRAFAGMVARLAAGETYTPNISWDTINAENARHAEEYAGADEEESLDILQASRDDILSSLGGLSDAELERSAGNFGGNELSVGQVVEYVVTGHPREHVASIIATLAS
jgi:uncharacterized damage-inducible protein DinB